MIVNVNMSQEVYDYFKNYNFDDLTEYLLNRYDFTVLPQTSGKRDIERKVNVNNQAYIQLYNIVGPRSKKISLGRLFEFAYNLDVLSITGFELKTVEYNKNMISTFIYRAYRILLDAQKYSNDLNLKEITTLVYEYYKGVHYEV